MTEEVIIELDDAREVMYEELSARFGSSRVDQLLSEVLRSALTDAYDNRERLSQQMEG